MSTKIDIFPVPPKLHIENLSKLADFAEIECLKRKDFNVSAVDISNIILRSDNADDLNEDRSDSANNSVIEAFEEIDVRKRACGANRSLYPFELCEQGTLVRYHGDRHEAPPTLYLYLLLATQLNMRTEKRHAGFDGTELFEELSAEVALRFLGGPSEQVKHHIFGTSRHTRDCEDHQEINGKVFESAVNNLCRELKEGLSFHSDPSQRVHAKDGKLDVVVWRQFADERHGQLIGFGQCKTGTHWKNDLTKLQPENFCSMWFKEQPAVKPFRMYFITDRVCSNWRHTCIEGGVLFDRCRILEYCRNLPTQLLDKIEKWVVAATAFKKLVLK
jgi:hypothetical protein